MEYLAFKLPGPEGNRIDPVAGMPDGGIVTVSKIISAGVAFLLVVLTLTSFIFFILGGIAWITSQGDKTKIEAARKRLVYAVIGLIVAFLSFFIINLIGQFFGGKLINV